MPLYRLLTEYGSPLNEWILEWNDSRMTLRNPDEEQKVDCPIENAHRLVKILELYTENKIRFDTSAGFYLFKAQKETLDDVKAFVQAGLKKDSDYRNEIKQKMSSMMVRSALGFFAAGTPFGIYCWLATWVPDPPDIHRFYWVILGSLIHLVLVFLLAFTIAGLCMFYHASKQLRIIKKIEREINW